MAEYFATVHAFVTTRSGGTGLRVSTVKCLVEAQPEAIPVNCSPEDGTTVVVSLSPAAN